VHELLQSNVAIGTVLSAASTHRLKEPTPAVAFLLARKLSSEHDLSLGHDTFRAAGCGKLQSDTQHKP